jgi:hypothetical protein
MMPPRLDLDLEMILSRGRPALSEKAGGCWKSNYAYRGFSDTYELGGRVLTALDEENAPITDGQLWNHEDAVIKRAVWANESADMPLIDFVLQ